VDNVQKLGVVAELFLLKALEGGVLHQFWILSLTEIEVETSMQTYRLSEEGFGYNY